MKHFATNTFNMKHSFVPGKLTGFSALFSFAMILIFSASGIAQDSRTAILNHDGIVQISENDVPDGRFEFDVSHLNFKSGSEMTTFFQERSGEHFILRALPHENKVIMLVRGENQPEWSVAEWNAHLTEVLAGK